MGATGGREGFGKDPLDERVTEAEGLLRVEEEAMVDELVELLDGVF